MRCPSDALYASDFRKAVCNPVGKHLLGSLHTEIFLKPQPFSFLSRYRRCCRRCSANNFHRTVAIIVPSTLHRLTANALMLKGFDVVSYFVDNKDAMGSAQFKSDWLWHYVSNLPTQKHAV
jgi:hypothetical protein